jgi:hypothetical protein
MSSQEHLSVGWFKAAVSDVSEACRAVRRPDAAQALEHRTAAEWAQACPVGGFLWKQVFELRTAHEQLFYMCGWENSPESYCYWEEVYVRLHKARRESHNNGANDGIL